MPNPIDIILRLVADEALLTNLPALALMLKSLQPAGQQAAQGLQQVSTAQAKMSQSAKDYIPQFDALNKVFGTSYTTVQNAIKAFEKKYGVIVKNTSAFRDYLKIMQQMGVSIPDIIAHSSTLRKEEEKLGAEITKIINLERRRISEQGAVQDKQRIANISQERIAQEKLGAEITRLINLERQRLMQAGSAQEKQKINLINQERIAQEKLGEKIARTYKQRTQADIENLSRGKILSRQSTELHRAVTAITGKPFKEVSANAYEASQAMQLFTTSIVREGPIKALERMRAAGISGKEVFKEYGREMSSFILGSRFGSIVLMTSVIYGLERAAKAAAQTFIELDSAIRKVMSAQVLDPAGLKMSYEGIRIELEKLSLTYNLTLKEAGEIFWQMKSAGLGMKESLEGSQVAAKLAKTDIQDLGTATRLVAGLNQNFGKSMAEVGDIIFYTLNKSLVDVDGLVNGFKHASAVAKTTGTDLYFVAASLAVLNDNMAYGGIAGRGFRQLLGQIAQDAEWLEKEFGIVLDKSMDEGAQLEVVFTEINKRLIDGRMNMGQFGELMSKFGTQGASALAGVEGRFTEFKKIYDDFKKGGHIGILETGTEERMAAVEQQLGRLSKAAKIIGAELAEWPVEKMSLMGKLIADITDLTIKSGEATKKWREEQKKIAEDRGVNTVGAAWARVTEEFLNMGTAFDIFLLRLPFATTRMIALADLSYKLFHYLNEESKKFNGMDFSPLKASADITQTWMDVYHVWQQISLESEKSGENLSFIDKILHLVLLSTKEGHALLSRWAEDTEKIKDNLNSIDIEKIDAAIYKAWQMQSVMAAPKLENYKTLEAYAYAMEEYKKRIDKIFSDEAKHNLNDWFKIDPSNKAFIDSYNRSLAGIADANEKFRGSLDFRMADQGKNFNLLNEQLAKTKDNIDQLNKELEKEPKGSEARTKTEKDILSLMDKRLGIQREIANITKKSKPDTDKQQKKEQAILNKYYAQKKKDQEAYFKSTIDGYDKLIYEISDRYSDQLDALDEAHDKGKMSEEEYQQELTVLIGHYEQARSLQESKNDEDRFKEAEKKLAEELKKQQDLWKIQHPIIVELNKELADDIQNVWSDFFFDAMEGKLDSLSDYFKAFATSVKRNIADIFGTQMSNWMMGGIKDFMGWNAPGTGGGTWGQTLLNWSGVGSASQASFIGPTGNIISAAQADQLRAMGSTIPFTPVKGPYQVPFIPSGMLGYGPTGIGPAGTIAGLATMYGGYKNAGWKGAAGAGAGYAVGNIGAQIATGYAANALISGGFASAGAAMGSVVPIVGTIVGAVVGKMIGDALGKGKKQKAKNKKTHAQIASDIATYYNQYLEKAGVGDVLAGTNTATSILGNVGKRGYADENIEKILRGFRAGGTSAWDIYAKGASWSHGYEGRLEKSIIKSFESDMYSAFKNIKDWMAGFPQYEDKLISMNKTLKESIQFVVEKETERIQDLMKDYKEEIAKLQEKHQLEMEYYNNLNAMIVEIGGSIQQVQRSRYSPDEMLAATWGDVQKYSAKLTEALIPVPQEIDPVIKFTGNFMSYIKNVMGQIKTFNELVDEKMGFGANKEDVLANAKAVEQAWLSWYQAASANINTLISKEQQIIEATKQMQAGIDANILQISLDRLSPEELISRYFQSIGDLELQLLTSTGTDALDIATKLTNDWMNYYQSSAQSIDNQIQDAQNSLSDTLKTFETEISDYQNMISGFSGLKDTITNFGLTPAEIQTNFSEQIGSMMASLGGLAPTDQLAASKNLQDTISSYFNWAQTNLRGDAFYEVRDSLKALFPEIDQILNAGLADTEAQKSAAEAQGQAIIDGLKENLGILKSETIAGLGGVQSHLGTVSGLSQEEIDRLNAVFDQIQAGTISGLTDLQSILQSESLIAQDRAVGFLEEINTHSTDTVAVLNDIAAKLGGEAFTPAAENISALNDAVATLTDQINTLKSDLSNVKVEIGVKQDGLSEYLLEASSNGKILITS